MREPDDLYAFLQVDPSADPEVIQAVYRRLALRYHPDRNKSLEAAEMMKRLNLAYEVLSDPVRRAAYDRARVSEGPPTDDATHLQTRRSSDEPIYERPRNRVFEWLANLPRVRVLVTLAGSLILIVTIVAVLVATQDGGSGDANSTSPLVNDGRVGSSAPTEVATPTRIPASPPTREPTPSPATLESTSGRASISITSTTTEVRPGGDLEVAVILDPQGKGISGVQVKIAYDPATLRPTEAVAGPLLGEESIEIPLIIDEVAGSVEYVAARIGSTAAPTPPGLVATIRFQALESATEGKLTSLKITGVQVPDENIQEIAGILVGESINIGIVP